MTQTQNKKNISEARSRVTLDYFIALSPIFVWAVWMFGLRVIILALSSLFCFLSIDFLAALAINRRPQKPEGAVALRALIFSLMLPVSAPIAVCAIAGALAAIVRWTQKSFPRLTGYVDPLCFAYVITRVIFGRAFAVRASAWSGFSLRASALTTAPYSDPLSCALRGSVGEASLLDMVIGNYYDAVGFVSSALILAGLLYLVLRRSVSLSLPLAFILPVGLYAYFFPVGDLPRLNNVFAFVCAGSLLFASVFLATADGVAPTTSGGKLLFGILCGALTIALRRFSLAFDGDGAIAAILILTPASRLFDRIFAPKPFGYAKTL